MKAGANVTICKGDSVQLNATGCSSYSWTPATGLSNSTISNPIAKPIITTTYVVSSSTSGNELIVNGDFAQGNTGFITGYTYCNTNNCLFPLGDNGYSIGPNAYFFHDLFTGIGIDSGNFMIVNGGLPSLIVWEETVTVQPNTDYAFSAWVSTMNLLGAAQLQFSINGIQIGPLLTAPSVVSYWEPFNQTWNSGTNNTATIKIVDVINLWSGDDFGLDDISFTPVHSSDSLVITVNSPPVVNTNFINQGKYLGNSATYSVSPTGTSPFGYQWYKDDAKIAGATNSIFNLNSITCLDSGIYSCRVGNLCDTIKAKVVHLYVLNCSRFRHALTGYVKYDNKDSTVMTNTTVYLSNSGDTIIGNSTTDNTGYYVFVNLINAKYKLSCSTNKAWGGVNPVDALIVNRTYIGMYNFTDPLKKLAADVNNDTKINPTDALIINRRYIGILNKFTINDWLFSNPNINVSGLDITNNIIAICAGDVNASYVPPARVMSYELGVISNNVINIDYNEPFDIPIYLNDNIELGAMGIKWRIENGELRITNVKSDIAGLIYNITDDGVNIAWAATDEGYDITPDKPLLVLSAKCSVLSAQNPVNNFIKVTSESVLADIDANMISTDKLAMPEIVLSAQCPVLSLTCYPNPANDIVTINFPAFTVKEKTNIELYSITGKLIEKLPIQSVLTQINISDLAKGVYIIKVMNDNGVVVKRIIKN